MDAFLQPQTWPRFWDETRADERMIVAYHKYLQCYLLSLAVVGKDHVRVNISGRPDMGGTIKFCEMIIPTVRQIDVHSGDEVTTYSALRGIDKIKPAWSTFVEKKSGKTLGPYGPREE